MPTVQKIGDNNNNNIQSNSSCLEIIQKRIAGFKPRFESGSPPIEVAKVILKSVTSQNPDLRYLVRNYAFKLIDRRKKIPLIRISGN